MWRWWKKKWAKIFSWKFQTVSKIEHWRVFVCVCLCAIEKEQMYTHKCFDDEWMNELKMCIVHSVRSCVCIVVNIHKKNWMTYFWVRWPHDNIIKNHFVFITSLFSRSLSIDISFLLVLSIEFIQANRFMPQNNITILINLFCFCVSRSSIISKRCLICTRWLSKVKS